MTFLWPQMLLLLLLVPALVGGYLWLLRRKKKEALRYASVTLVKEAIGPGQTIRRHLPAAILLLSFIAAIIAVARPTAVVTLPSKQQTIILAIDVSLSMGARDVDPNRITAAQAAAKAFVSDHPPEVKIGIVSFGATASLVQPPTRSREDLLEAIDRFQLQRGTATGSALYVALSTLFPEADIDLESLVFSGGLTRNGSRTLKSDKAKPEKPPIATTGPDPLDAAKWAADHGVRVFTVGFGTAEGGTIGFEGWSAYVRLDEETLKAIADITRAEYFYAGTAADLAKVYQALNAKLVLEKKDTEITALFSAIAAAFALGAAGLSLLWFRR
jgi:Ca-activated chloride channel family protein